MKYQNNCCISPRSVIVLTPIFNELLGNEALDYLNCCGKFADRTDGHPAVVLLDLKLPKVSGLEVLRQMKTDETLRCIPVVILTSSREDQDILEGYKLGANSYVVKPMDFHEFINAIKLIGIYWAIVSEPPPVDRCKTK